MNNFKDVVYRALITNGEILSRHPHIIINLLNGQLTINTLTGYLKLRYQFISNGEKLSTLNICVLYDSPNYDENIHYYFRIYINHMFDYIKLDINDDSRETT